MTSEINSRRGEIKDTRILAYPTTKQNGPKIGLEDQRLRIPPAHPFDYRQRRLRVSRKIWDSSRPAGKPAGNSRMLPNLPWSIRKGSGFPGEGNLLLLACQHDAVAGWESLQATQ